jgi:hyperosmotically inducible protein
MKHLTALWCSFSLTAAALPAGPQARAPEHTIDPGTAVDGRISRDIHEKLMELPYYGVFDYLSYGVNARTVTLVGRVTNPALKTDAVLAVKMIPGVERVTSQIQVLPATPGDTRIRIASYRALYGQPPLDRYAMQVLPPIHIVVANARVTLEGTAASQAEKNIAGAQAASVKGVLSVTNNLRVVR